MMMIDIICEWLRERGLRKKKREWDYYLLFIIGYLDIKRREESSIRKIVTFNTTNLQF